MEVPEELQKWVNSLSGAEKRFVKLLGKARSGASPSQQLELFDWLNKSGENKKIPAGSKLAQNLPTVSARLRDMIIDSLRILNKTNSTDALLRNSHDEIAILSEKKIYPAALRQIRRSKKLALESCNYTFALQYLEWEHRIVQLSDSNDLNNILSQIRKEEIAVLKKTENIRDLQNRHDLLLNLVRQFPYHRDKRILKEVQELSGNEIVSKNFNDGNFLEKALAINILGIRDLYFRKPEDALKRYQKLLKDWKAQPKWQNDHSSLLLLICKFYQRSCFFSKVNWKEAMQYLSAVHEFKALPADESRHFHLMLNHNQFTLALNTGNLNSVKKSIAEIDDWLRKEDKNLSETQTLPFLCNFAVAEFLLENFASANHFVNRILNMPDKNARKDIREFALVLQAVVQFELGNSGLNEYLARAGKRRFSKTGFEINFELAVFKHLELLLRENSPKAIKQSIEKLISDLGNLAARLPDGIPLLGLNEIHMWAKSKLNGQPLREVFLSEVKKNLAALGQEDLMKEN